MNREALSAIYDRHYNPTLALLFDLARCPIEDRARGMHVFDADGEAYLDFAAGYGVFSVGHGNERVRAAMLAQLRTLATAPRLGYSEPALRLCEKLAALLPGDLQQVLLCGSGSEAVEIALRIAGLTHPRRTGLVAANHGFHGKTLGAVGICGQSYLRRPFEPIWNDVRFVRYGELDDLTAAVGAGVAAVILEPVLGGGFITVPPPGYLAAARELCDRTGTLLVIDEVQTGFGRTGRLFAIEHDGIVPDVLILSKGLTGGHVSMAAAVVRRPVFERIAEVYPEDPLAYESDSAASPVSCAAAAAALDFIVDERLPQRAAEIGPYLQEGLARAAADFPRVGLGAPGLGLMTGLRLRNNMVENALWLQMLKRKVVTGLSTNPATPTPVMRFFPPLVVGKAEIDTAVAALRDALAELGRMPGPALDLANAAARYQFHLPKPLLRSLLGALR
jgi:putrescine aminotransferase